MEFEVGRRGIHRAEDDIHLVGPRSPLQPFAAASDPHVHPDAGVTFVEPLQVPGKYEGRGGLPGRDVEVAGGDAAVELGEGAGKTVQAFHQGGWRAGRGARRPA